MAVCIVCGRFDDSNLRTALSNGWSFVKCPECQRGMPLDITVGYMLKKTGEQLVQGFCPDHWYRQVGVCSYCAKRLRYAI